ncbi:hypothetical protein pb186bvf_010595 [Paramecium bursaria]
MKSIKLLGGSKHFSPIQLSLIYFYIKMNSKTDPDFSYDDIDYVIHRSFQEQIDSSFNDLKRPLTNSFLKEILDKKRQKQKEKIQINTHSTISMEPQFNDYLEIDRDKLIRPQLNKLQESKTIQRKRFITIQELSHTKRIIKKQNRHKSVEKQKRTINIRQYHPYHITEDNPNINESFMRIRNFFGSKSLILSRSQILEYLIFHLKSEQHVRRAVNYLQLHKFTTQYLFRQFILQFNEWSQLEIQLFCFHIFDIHNKGIIDTSAVLNLTLSGLTQDARVLQLNYEKYKNKSYVVDKFCQKILSTPNMNQNLYKQLQKEQEILDHRMNIRMKVLYSSIKEFTDLHVQAPKRECDPLIVYHNYQMNINFTVFQNIYQQQIPHFFQQLIWHLSGLRLTSFQN